MKQSSDLPADIVANLRRLAHDLSNSLETILQASYLLGQAGMEGNHKKWADMIENAAREGADIISKIRKVPNGRLSIGVPKYPPKS